MVTIADATRLAQVVNEIQNVGNELCEHRKPKNLNKFFLETLALTEPNHHGRPHPCDRPENKGP